MATIEQLRRVVVKSGEGQRPVLLEQVADIVEAAQTKRGDSSVNGEAAVVLTVQKQPGADTRALTESVRAALDDIRPSLPPDVQLNVTYEQREFIDHSVENVLAALRDGAILVVIVLFLFLFNFRTAFITLTAIPVSVLVTSLCFWWMDMSINVMTLGGLAVALGELVDDAIVGVENIFRRLRLNATSTQPISVLRVIYEASSEVRGAILISTILVICRLHAAAYVVRYGRPFVPAARRGLHRVDRRIDGGVANPDAGPLVLPAGARSSLGGTS